MKQTSWRVVLVLFSLPLFLFLKSAQAQTANWFDANQSLELKLIKEGVQKPNTTYWGFPCTKVEPYHYYNKSYQTVNEGTATDACSYIANYGQVNQDRTLMLAGTSTSYRVNYEPDSPVNEFMVPIPQSDDLLIFNSKLGIYRDLPNNIVPQYRQVLGFSKVENYRLTNVLPQTERAKYQDGNFLTEIKPNGFSFSKDGRFTALNIGRYQVLIDNETLNVRKFGTNSVPSGRTTSQLMTSLNSNGSVALTSNSFFTNSHVLYNLENCTVTSVEQPEDCEKLNLTQLFKSVVPDYNKVALARFVSDSRIEVYFEVKDSEGRNRIDQYELSLPGANASKIQYLGLGDSYASGEGSHDYKLNTDVEENMCHLSANSYPYLIKNVLNYSSAESVACSGAKIKDIFNTPVYVNDKPQSKGKDDVAFDSEIYTNFLPGYRRQIDFVQNYQPETVTISVGGNDINFGKKLLYCILTPSSCYEDKASRQRIWQEIKGQFTRLTQVYEELKKASPETKFYVVGYPYIVKPGGSCANNVRLSAGELQTAEDIEHDLNEAIRLAAQKVGFIYVDTSEAFAGARLCEGESWKLAVNGVTAGNDKFSVIGNETYHPNKLGHSLYKGVILSQTDNLTKPMPIAAEEVQIENLESRLSPTGTPADEDPTSVISNDDISSDFIKAGSRLLTSITNIQQFFKPGSTLSIEVHSTPTVVGEATASTITTLNIDAQLPEDLELGPHEIHIKGTNIDNEPIDIYKNIIVYATEEDWDGDGVLNTNDQCNFISPVGVDTDKDGIDDGCDSEITEPPVEPPEDPTPEQPDPEPVKPVQRFKLFLFKLIKSFFSFLQRLYV